MTIAYWTNSLSPHQLPLAREIVKRVGEGNYRYLYRDEPTTERRGLGWNFDFVPEWCRRATEDDPALMDADLVYTGGLRPLGLMARRIAAGKKTYYVTERWFKSLCVLGMNLPGRWRMFSHGYRRMAKRMVAMLNNPLCKVLAIGPWAKKDMQELGVREEQIVDWGYFVEDSRQSSVASRQSLVLSDYRLNTNDYRLTTNNYRLTTNTSHTLKLLWVGRILRLKHVDTIIRAVQEVVSRQSSVVSDHRLTTNDYRLTTNNSLTPSLPHSQLSFDIYGTGPEEPRLRKLAARYSDVIKFHQPVPIDEVRKLMREHDVYVMASDENEGWGAVVSEALQEGMRVLGTFESGASAAILPKERLFHAGDWRVLADLIVKEWKGELPACSIGDWTAEKAAERLVESEGVGSEGVGRVESGGVNE